MRLRPIVLCGLPAALALPAVALFVSCSTSNLVPRTSHLGTPPSHLGTSTSHLGTRASTLGTSARTDLVQAQSQSSESSQASGPAKADGWQIPQGAPEEKNPIPQSEQTIAKGKEIYESKCRRCHGPEGRGDGPDADADHMPEDLSDPARASRNPDGVMFYKVWNGRKKPKMPAFKTELSREEVWTVIHFAKTLRK